MQAAANPAFQVLPMDAQGNVVQPTGTTFDAAMAELLATPAHRCLLLTVWYRR